MSILSSSVPVIGLALLAALSPLLTFAALFQQKEWRLDRLREHLRREGWFVQLFGKIRPALFVLYLLLLTIGPASRNVFLPAILVVFATLAVVQFLLRKQRTPVWTGKAILIVFTALLLTLATGMFVPSALQPLLILLAPAAILGAWLFLLPLDRFLKQRAFRRAEELRAALVDPVIIGIAGSVGKTTTKELLSHLLSNLHPTVTPAHVNTELGIAQWFIRTKDKGQRTKDDGRTIIVEMGAYRTGEIALTCSFLHPTIGIVTALGSDHLALFGSEAAIDAANAELLAALPKDGHAFLLAENKRSAALQPLSPAPVTLAGTAEDADVRLTDVREDAGGLTFSLGETRCALPLHGQHNAGNAALAIACALHLGISAQRIRTLLTEMQPVAHTFSVRTERGVLLLDDTYNISPLSLRAALDWANSRSERPRILLTSGLLETGAEEVRFLRELGTYAQGRVERVLFTTSHGAAAFGAAWNGHVEILAPDSAPAPSRSVLLCVGRMPLSTIQHLLPPAS